MIPFLIPLLLSLFSSPSLASDPDINEFLGVFNLPPKESRPEPTVMERIRSDVDWSRASFQAKFDGPDANIYVSQIPLLLAFEKFYSVLRSYSLDFSEIEISEIVTDALKSYFDGLDPITSSAISCFSLALAKKYDLLTFQSFSLSTEFISFCGLLDVPSITEKKQLIIDTTYNDLVGLSVWDDHVLEGLEVSLKEKIIDKRDNVKEECERRYGNGRRIDHYVGIFESLKRFPEINAFDRDKFRSFSKNLIKFLFYRYICKAENPLSKLCTTFPRLEGKLNVLKNHPLFSKFLISYFKDKYDSKIFTGLWDNLETWEENHSELISDAEAIMLKDIMFKDITFKDFGLPASFLDLLDLPEKDDFEPIDLRDKVKNARKNLNDEFAKPDIKPLLERRIPLFLELVKLFSTLYLSSESFAELEFSLIVINTLDFYFNSLDPSSRGWCGEFIQALDDKFELLSSLPFALPEEPEEFKTLCQLLDDHNVVDQKQTIINRIHTDLNDSQKWDDSVLKGLEEPLKNSIIDLKNEIEKKYKEKYKYNNVSRLWDRYAESFESLKKDFLEIEGMNQVDFRNFSIEFMRFLLFRYLWKTEKSLSELCSNFPHLKGPVNVLDKLLGSGVFLSYFEKMYKTQLDYLQIYSIGDPEAWEKDHSVLISKAEPIMLNTFWPPKSANSSESTSSEEPGSSGMGKILGITFTVVAVILAACGAVFFLRQKRSKAAL